MEILEAFGQYEAALKAGRKFYKDAVSSGKYPYPIVLDDILKPEDISSSIEIGITDIPADLIAGTKTQGRISALAGNFMPLLSTDTEFAHKWISLCSAHLSDEGIRDPIVCFEYLGRFYVEEGNKRASVLMSYGAPTVPARIIRLVPKKTDDPEIDSYYYFMKFYECAGLYGISFRQGADYDRLVSALGLERGHVWTEQERRSFSAGFARFKETFRKINSSGISVSAAEALLVFLGVFHFSEIKTMPSDELAGKIRSIWNDICAVRDTESGDADRISVKTQPDEAGSGVISRFFGVGRKEHVNAAFIYAFSPEKSVFTLAHEHGRRYIEENMGDRVSARVYEAFDHDYDSAMERAVMDGADVIFATTPPMINACRRTAALFGNVRVLICALSLPYSGVRTYYCRQYECRFISGAIAGAFSENNRIGYISNYPIFGSIANINAFAYGAAMTNPRAKICLDWSCIPGDPVERMREKGVEIYSDVFGTVKPYLSLHFNWGNAYAHILESILDGSYDSQPDRIINYWWGLDSGVTDIGLTSNVRSGVRALSEILKQGIITGSVDPFNGKYSIEELMLMETLADNVEGSIPAYEEIISISRETVRTLGIYKDSIPPETEAAQL